MNKSVEFWKKFPENIPPLNGQYFVKVKTGGRGIYTGVDTFGNVQNPYPRRKWSEFKNVVYWADIPQTGKEKETK